MKIAERIEARRLRSEEGRSIKEIARILSVSPGSVSRWVRDVKLTDEQISCLVERNPIYNQQISGAYKRKEICLQRRREWQEEGRNLARCKDIEFIAGCMLYWGEGDKSRNTLGLTNTNPHMLIFFMKFAKKFLGICDDDFRVYIQCYSDNGKSLEEIENYWIQTLGLPKSCLRKSTIDNHTKYSKKKKRIHPYGTCKVRANNTRAVQIVYGSIQEYIGFEKEEWMN